MKGIIVYFSLTGSTQKIARAIHAGMKQVMGECDIAKLKEVDARDLGKYDLIGLGSPIWRATAPANVMAFIKGLPSLEGKHGFPFCTHGALPAGFMKRVVPPLMRQGLTIIGYNDWYGSCFLPYMPKPYLTDGHPDEIDLREAEDFGREMAERSQRISSGETHLIPELPEGTEPISLWRTDTAYPYDMTEHDKKVINIRKITRKQRKINMEKCRYPECRLCVDNCPVNSIDFSVSPPVFKKSCMMDWLCEIICPEGAIEADFDTYVKVHDVPIKEVFAKFLEEEEAKGRFRRLVPADKVGWDTHYYQITGHPRFVIPE